MAIAFNAFSDKCWSRLLVEHITSRWTALVLASLADGPRRFAEIARTVAGISDRMLSQTLSTLAGDGLVRRTELPGQRVEYELTDAGHRVALALQRLIDTVYEVMPDVLLARGEAG